MNFDEVCIIVISVQIAVMKIFIRGCSYVNFQHSLRICLSFIINLKSELYLPKKIVLFALFKAL